MLKSNLLATKLHRPPRPAKWVQRPFLNQRLTEGLELNRQITLVSAPAGFGKTTCVSEWVSTVDLPVAWLSLDAADDDPGRFFAYLLAALQTVDTTLGKEIEGVLRAGQFPPGEIISNALINDFFQSTVQFLLVLDDFHVIQDTLIFQVLTNLIANPAPLLHLVLITREDPPLPLARLRANNLLTEIRARDLRFTSHDTACFLRGLGLTLSQANMANLEDKTEGWIAGLQLAAIALQSSSVQDGGDPSGFIAGLSGSHRFILSYLTEQVLDQQSEDVRYFLLQTAVLDKLHGDLCNVVTGRTDGRFMLDRLFNANLFLIPLDDEGQWYRYHHLFADLLRDRQRVLLEGETAVLHQRASRWYAQENMINEAIQHALAAADFARAVALLESHAMRLIMQGYVKTVDNWVQAIPDRWQSQSPKTNLAFAWMHLLRGTYAQAAPYLERLQTSFSSSQIDEQEGRSLKAEWLVMQSLLLNMKGAFGEGLAMIRESLEIVPERDNRVRSLTYFGLAASYQAAENYESAVEAYQLAIRYGRAADNLVAEMLSVSGLAMMAFDHGQLHLAFEIAVPVSNRIERSGSLSPISTVVYGILGEVYYQWCQTREAQRHLQHALELSTLGGYKSGMINCRVLLSRLSQLEGDLEAAADKIREAAVMAQAETPDYVQQEIAAQQVCVFLAQSRPAAARMILQGQGFSFEDGFAFPAFPSDQSISHSLGLLYNSSLRFLLHQAQIRHDLASLEPGVKLADSLIARMRQGQSIVVTLEALLLRAQMHTVLGNHRNSQADYLTALELGEPEGFLGVFIEQGLSAAEALTTLVRQHRIGAIQPGYIKRILAAFSDVTLPSEKAPSIRPLIDPLTERELEVLVLIAEGLKYEEIATALTVSLNTVRYHVKAIYGKLNVNNRTQAIRTARQHQIL